jgi:hypothetical protein
VDNSTLIKEKKARLMLARTAGQVTTVKEMVFLCLPLSANLDTTAPRVLEL